MDMGSKTLAAQMELDKADFKTLSDHIDKRHAMQFGVLDMGKKSADDMDVSAVGFVATTVDTETGDETAGESAPTLDYFKGKGGQKGGGGGQSGQASWGAPKTCHNCGGIHNLSKDCATTDTSVTHKCHKCGGAGHFARDCTTPSGKGIPKGDGKGNDKGAQKGGYKGGGYGGGNLAGEIMDIRKAVGQMDSMQRE